MAVVKLAINPNPAAAFIENVAAYEMFPYQVETRRQLPGSFLAMISTGRADIDPNAAEIVWAISKTVSPVDAAALVSRASYLLNYGRRDEMETIAANLKRVAPWSIETWIIEAYAALQAKDKARMAYAIERATTSERKDVPAVDALAEEFRRLH